MRSIDPLVECAGQFAFKTAEVLIEGICGKIADLIADGEGRFLEARSRKIGVILGNRKILPSAKKSR